MSVESEASTSGFVTGLGILLLAQLLSAFMGSYTEDTYAMYNASWTENLFYSHALSLPLFLPISRLLQGQWSKLSATAPLKLGRNSLLADEGVLSGIIPALVVDTVHDFVEGMPQGLFFLLVNAITQLACISGVNLLSATTSAVTVTIVLNIRKLVSFIFSTIIFGHQLSNKMILGSAIVFGSGALYGWETSWRLPRERKSKSTANGSAKKTL